MTEKHNGLTKAIMLKKARRHLRKNHLKYKAKKAEYDTESGVWFVYISAVKEGKAGYIKYSGIGVLVNIELDEMDIGIIPDQRLKKYIREVSKLFA